MNRPDGLDGQVAGRDYIKPLSGAGSSLLRQLEAARFAERRRADVLAQVAACAIIEGHVKDRKIEKLERLVARNARLHDLRTIRTAKEKEGSLHRKFSKGVERIIDGLGNLMVKVIDVMAKIPQYDSV